MARYKSLSDKWAYIPTRVDRGGDWKKAMLGFTGVKSAKLSDLHLIASKPSHQGSYSDAHVTFVLKEGNAKHHIYYQVNNDKLVADYVLAPKGWKSSYWLNFPELREAAEAELLNLVRYCRSEGTLDEIPSAV
ncbi:hypothetical protein [Viridibacterium curvum]|uniref:Uncharacterized protein n=1 Tax=Viridibacterium curvum TaxID=1101404 RepID=A0ABP9QUC1_9RHOO